MPTNKFHYIWMGRVPAGRHEDSFKNGPNALAEQLREYVMNLKERSKDAPNPQDQEIIMWVPEAIIEGIKEAGLLDPDITLKPIEDMYRKAKHLTKEERENLQTTVEVLGEHNAYSAQKDILEAAILEEYGGYYLDTTSEVDSVEHLINNQPDHVWFPRITEEAEKSFDGDGVILPDVWAMYNPTPGEGTCKAMLNGYIQRCQFYFPEKYEGVTLDPADFEGRTGFTVYGDESYGAGSQIMVDPAHRDELIGQLVIFSLYDGVKQKKGNLDDETMLSLSSYAKTTLQGKAIDEFGITKFHRGTWRQQAIAEGVEERAELRAEERVELRAEERVEVRAEERVEVRAEERVEVRAEERAEVRAEERAEVRAEERVEVRAEERVEVRAEERAEVRAEGPEKPVESHVQAPPLPKKRFHAYTIEGDDFVNFKAKYQLLKGDILKHQILVDFAEKLSKITDKETLDHFVADFKKSSAYATLSKGQGVATRLFSLNTDCVAHVDNLVQIREEELEIQKLSLS
jgi:hypothetical protein